MPNKTIYVGVDIGSSRTKVAVLDRAKNLIGRGVLPSGTDFEQSAVECLEIALKMANAEKGDITRAFSTGYGRKNVPFVDGHRTEISCHGAGCFHYFPQAITIVDIGGQDNKIIKLDSSGQRTSFKMNRKCAAGTGAFLEEMSVRLNIPLEEMNDKAVQSEDAIKIGSYCTVFSGTEVLEHIRHGKKVTDIVKGLFYSVIKRVREMDSFGENVVLTGGVIAHNPYMVEMTEEIIGRKVSVPEYPQFTGAIGAALFAIKDSEDKEQLSEGVK
jgi:predicted CoA-substrate-specific enzyme activase